MCYSHLSGATFFNNLDNNNKSTIVQGSVNKFAEKYKSILTNSEYDFFFSNNAVHKIQTIFTTNKIKRRNNYIKTWHYTNTIPMNTGGSLGLNTR